jgi:hypothetical protein
MNPRTRPHPHPRPSWISARVSRWSLLLLVMLLGLAGCGYVGDTLPPALYIPLPVADLSALQDGDEILVQFSMPSRSTEDLLLESIPEVDLRIAVWEDRDWDEAAWEQEAARIPVDYDLETGKARVPAGPWVGRHLLMRVRVAGRKQRFSSWSEPFAFRVADPQPVPTDVSMQPRAEGLAIRWHLPEPGEHSAGRVAEVWRQLDGEEEPLLIGETEEDSFLDRTSPFGNVHRYRLRTRVSGRQRLAFSAFTAMLEVQPADTFAPDAPQGLLAVAAANTIELSWQAVTAPDFAFYRVYRAVDEQDFELLADKVVRSVYSDATAPAGIPLRYRVTALDEAGNEGPPTEAVAVELPQ